MATQNCGLPQCGNKETSSVSVVKLSSSECEVILYRFGVNLEYLFSKHHKDQFSRYDCMKRYANFEGSTILGKVQKNTLSTIFIDNLYYLCMFFTF